MMSALRETPPDFRCFSRYKLRVSPNIRALDFDVGRNALEQDAVAYVLAARACTRSQQCHSV